MVLLGTLVNGFCILLGGGIGMILDKIPESMKKTVMQGIGVVLLVLGMNMAMQSNNSLILIVSVVIGVVLGEWWAIEDKFNSAGKWLETKLKSTNSTSLAQGFVTATLVFILGAMSILGPLDSGIRGDHQILFTKAIIEGFIAIVLATTLGVGVLFAAIPVIIYEGIIALFAMQIDQFVPPEALKMLLAEFSAVGGVMIIAIGLDILGLLKVKVANFLPSILVVAAIIAGIYLYQSF